MCVHLHVNAAPISGATVNSDAKNIASVMFYKTTLDAEASGHLDYWSDEQYGGILWFFALFCFVFLTWSPFSVFVWEIPATALSW